MPLPDTPQFEELLNSFSSGKPEGTRLGWREFTAIPAMVVNDNGEMIKRPAIVFWYKESGELGLASLLKKISSSLTAQGHPGNLEIASTLAAFFVYARRPSGSAVDQFNEIFSEIAEADLTQHYLIAVLGVEATSTLADGNIGAFRVGNFDPERLKYQTTRAGSDYFMRYEDVLRRVHWSLEREFRPVKVVFWPAFDAKPNWDKISNRPGMMSRLIDAYFARISSVYLEDFFKDFESVQEIPTALGAGWIEPDFLRKTLGAHQISIYLNIAGRKVGFVSPTATQRMEVNFGGAHRGVTAAQTFLREKFDFESPSDCEIHQSLKSFGRFLALAEKHDLEGRNSEAFLHCVIALDLLLGDIGASTAAVSSRGALLTHGVLKKDYNAAAKELQKIYGARSKYVHEGRAPDTALLDSVRVICREIAFVLFRLQKSPSNQTSGFLARWLKDVDYVIAAVEAGRSIAAEDWRRIGVANHDDVTWADFSKMLKGPIAPISPGSGAVGP